MTFKELLKSVKQNIKSPKLTKKESGKMFNHLKETLQNPNYFISCSDAIELKKRKKLD